MSEQYVTSQLPEAVRITRNPEARSPYSDVLAGAMRDYLGEIFNQNNPSPEVKELQRRNGLIPFEGSVLRGTATEKTADFDLHIFYDSDLNDETAPFKLIGLIEELHPRKETFAIYLSKSLLIDPNLTKFYSARAKNRQRRMDYIEISNNRQPVPRNLDRIPEDAYWLIHLDEDVSSYSNLYSGH